jgi:hypothetical protein
MAEWNAKEKQYNGIEKESNANGCVTTHPQL